MSTKTAQTDYERRFAAYLDLMASCAADLVVGYVALHGMVARSGSAPAGGGGGGGKRDDVPTPVDLGVVDVMTAVEQTVNRYVPLVRGALRMGLSVDERTARQRRTVEGLRFLGKSLPRVYDVDPVLGDNLADALWGARHDVARYTGEGMRPYRLEQPCPACGSASVWVNPEGIKTRCAACGDTAGWSVSQLVHVTTSATRD